jgi:hypothetical protein
MVKLVDFDIWMSVNHEVINASLDKIINSLKACQIPATLEFDFEFSDNLKDDILLFLYKTSSSSLRKR